MHKVSIKSRQNKADRGATTSWSEVYFFGTPQLHDEEVTWVCKVLARFFYDANASSGISKRDISSFLIALIAASTSGSTFLMKYLALESLPV